MLASGRQAELSIRFTNVQGTIASFVYLSNFSCDVDIVRLRLCNSHGTEQLLSMTKIRYRNKHRQYPKYNMKVVSAITTHIWCLTAFTWAISLGRVSEVGRREDNQVLKVGRSTLGLRCLFAARHSLQIALSTSFDMSRLPEPKENEQSTPISQFSPRFLQIRHRFNWRSL